MSLYRRGRIWYCEWEIGGQRVRETTGTADRKSAQEYHDRRRAALWREDRLGDVVTTWEQAALDWIDDHACHKKSYADDQLRLRWVTGRLQGLDIRAITTETLLALRRAKRGANATKNRHLAVVSAVLHYAHTRGRLAAVPKIPYLPEAKGRIRWITKEQARALLAELPRHLSDMAQFALATGLRRHNVTHLMWQDVDLERAVAWVWPDEMKSGKPHAVPLNATAIESLHRNCGDSRYVFVYRKKPVHATSTKAWYLACERAGIQDFSWHDLRHTWASWHVMAGTPLEVLRQLGGWADMEMVLRYAHLAPGYVAQYADRVSLSDFPSARGNDSDHSREELGLVGWTMGLEPTTAGITILPARKKRA